MSSPGYALAGTIGETIIGHSIATTVLDAGFWHCAAGDYDGDGTSDPSDPCTDSDGDGYGNPGFPNPGCSLDNCPDIPNPDQLNNDRDALGDACDPDDDNDGVLDEMDNCPDVPNPDQLNNDGDALGDACDPCPNDPVNDDDADGICGDVDNCPTVFNPGQDDADNDGSGNDCDDDDDNDGILDDGDGSGRIGDNRCRGGQTNACDDNCQFVPNPNQEDGNGNGIGTPCEPTCELFIGEDPTPGSPAPDYLRIAEAMEAVAESPPERVVKDGCTLWVRPGTYTDPLVLDRYVNLLAVGDATNTFIDAGGVGTAIHIPDRPIPGRVTIQGFTIRNAAIAVDADESLLLRSSRIQVVTQKAIRLGLGGHELDGVVVDATGAVYGLELVQFASAKVSRVRVQGAVTANASVAGAGQVVNSLFVDSPGEGLSVGSTGSLDLSFCTVAGNGIGLQVFSPSVEANHTIVYGNTTDMVGVVCTQFTNCDLGIDCTGSGGNIMVDPQFVNAANGDYHVVLASPVVDAGMWPALFTGIPCLDYDGHPRLLDADGNGFAQPDMGAYEFDNSSNLHPGDVSNLRFPYNNFKVLIQWDAESDSHQYYIYRTVLSTLGYTYEFTCEGNTNATAFILQPENPAPAEGFGYVVSGRNQVLEEGTLGFGTCAERSNFIPCP